MAMSFLLRFFQKSFDWKTPRIIMNAFPCLIGRKVILLNFLDHHLTCVKNDASGGL